MKKKAQIEVINQAKHVLLPVFAKRWHICVEVKRIIAMLPGSDECQSVPDWASCNHLAVMDGN